jgi:Protein of unknown function (DUF2442)
MAKRNELREANAKAAKMRATLPGAIGARYDRRIGRVVVNLATGLEISFAPHAVQGLEAAKPADLSSIEISPSGFGLHFPRLDADIYLPALLEGFLGSKSWMAARLGERGGQARTEAKVAAARANGKLGGRPRKTAA